MCCVFSLLSIYTLKEKEKANLERKMKNKIGIRD